MRTLVVGLLLSAAGLWLLGRGVRAFARGITPRFFAPMGASLAFRDRPLQFVVQAGLWLVCGASLAVVGGTGAAAVEPLIAIAAPAGVIAAWSVVRVLRRRGGRSGDGGQHAFEALAAGDHAALQARVEALPEGGERSVLVRVLAAWSPASATPPGYRDGPTRAARPPLDALADAVADEKRALMIALLPAAAGLVPALTFTASAAALTYVQAAIIAAAVDATITVGAVVAWVVARREHDAFAASAREAVARPR